MMLGAVRRHLAAILTEYQVSALESDSDQVARFIQDALYSGCQDFIEMTDNDLLCRYAHYLQYTEDTLLDVPGVSADGEITDAAALIAYIEAGMVRERLSMGE